MYRCLICGHGAKALDVLHAWAYHYRTRHYRQEPPATNN